MSYYDDLSKVRVKLYDWPAAARERRMLNVKKAFAEECAKDNKLDEDYKKYVSDPKNVTVVFNDYGFGLKFGLSWVEVTASYNYSYTTSSVSDFSVKDNGNISVNCEYSDHTDTHRSNYSVYPRKMEKFECGFGPSVQSDMVEVANDGNLPAGLRAIAGKRPTENDVETAIKTFANSDRITNDIKSQIHDSYRGSTAKKINFEGVYDYRINTPFEAWCCPKENFTIRTTYHNKVYTQTCASISQMKSDGPLSASYREYEKARNGLHAPFSIILRVLAFLLTLGCGLANCICLIHDYIWPYLVLIAYFALQSYICYRISDDFCAVYSDKIPIKILVSDMKKSFKRHQIANTVTMLAFALVPTVCMVLFMFVLQ